MKLNAAEIELIGQYPLAIVATQKLKTSISSAMPLLLSPCGNYLTGHLANNNPLLKDLGNDKVEIYFTGANGYISPTWSCEQRVPTWNYTYAHINATAEIVSERDAKLKLMSEISDYFDKEWSFDEFLKNESALAKSMLNAITVIRFRISSVHSKFKLSQNRSESFRNGVATELSALGNLNLAKMMLSN